MKRRVKYHVWYGDCTSKQLCYNLGDVNAFVAHCLRENIKITGITKA